MNLKLRINKYRLISKMVIEVMIMIYDKFNLEYIKTTILKIFIIYFLLTLCLSSMDRTMSLFS